tara:strand:- start:5460 stop:5735 length:276 start_codon:yes stop_codon:yes gene_type:complete
MKKKVMKLLFSSSKKNKQSAWDYFLNDKQVSQLEYYELSHIENYSAEELKKYYEELKQNEPFDALLFQEWENKLAIIDNLINTKDNEFLFI